MACYRLHTRFPRCLVAVVVDVRNNIDSTRIDNFALETHHFTATASFFFLFTADSRADRWIR